MMIMMGIIGVIVVGIIFREFNSSFDKFYKFRYIWSTLMHDSIDVGVI